MVSARTKQVIGFTAGAATGAATTAGAGMLAMKVLGAAAKAAGPRAAGYMIPGVGWVLAGGTLAAAAVNAYRTGRDTSARGGSAKEIAGAAALGFLGVNSAAAQEVVKPRVYDAGPAKKPGGEGRKDAARSKGIVRQVEAEADRQAGKVAAGKPDTAPVSPPDKPKGVLRKAIDEVRDIFTPEPNAELAARRKGLETERDIIQKQMAKGVDKGAGIRPETKAAADANAKALKDLAEEERRNNPLNVAFQLGLPFGAAAAGGLIGSKLAKSTVEASAAAAGQVAKQVDNLAKQANALVKASPKGVIAGTVKGDKARAVVSEAYALGGAKSPFASPGYPTPPSASQVFEKLGKPSNIHYVVPAFGVVEGAAAVGASFKVEDPTTRMILRTEGAAALSMGLWGGKALLAARTVRPSSTSIASLESARNRLSREARSGPATIAEARARRMTTDANATVTAARGRADRVAINSGARTDAARTRSKMGVVNAGADLGVAKVRGAGRVERAQIDTKSRNTRALQRAQGPDIRYKNTWQDSRGRVYHRKDMSVRTRKGKPVANDNQAVGRARA